ncbi:MAG: hypothetical protein Fur0010_15440 [Bdellovibrio sp.]
MHSLIVFGLASQQVITTITVQGDEDENLMEFLRSHGVPVASSCCGMGVCKKCVINGNILSCMTTIAEWIKKYPQQRIEISYL